MVKPKTKRNKVAEAPAAVDNVETGKVTKKNKNNGPKMTAYQKAKLQYEKIQAEKRQAAEKRKEEREQQEKEREDALSFRRKKDQAVKKRTRKGQPNLNAVMNCMVEKLMHDHAKGKKKV